LTATYFAAKRELAHRIAVRMAASKSNEAAKTHEKAMLAHSREANKHYDEAAASAAEAMRTH